MRLVVLDSEQAKFKVTSDGKTSKFYPYRKNGKLNLDVFEDHPGYTFAVEQSHLNPKPASGTDRGAQIYYETEINELYQYIQDNRIVLYVLPQQMTKRILQQEGLKSANSCMAWYRHWCKSEKIIFSQVRLWKPMTAADRRRNELRTEVRLDSCPRIDSMAGGKYKHSDVKKMHEILEWGRLRKRVAKKSNNAERRMDTVEEDMLPKTMIDDCDIKFYKKGGAVRPGFNYARVMSLFVTAVDKDGNHRVDQRDNFLGIETLRCGILQFHPFRIGKRAHASARAKVRARLKIEENKARGVKDKKQTYLTPLPEVRKRHELVNRQILRLIRDYCLAQRKHITETEMTFIIKDEFKTSKSSVLPFKGAKVV